MFCGCACVCWMGTCSTHLDERQLRDPELLGVPPECQLEDFAASRCCLGRVGSEEEVSCRQPWMELQAAPLAVGIAHDHTFDLVCIDAEAALRRVPPRHRLGPQLHVTHNGPHAVRDTMRDVAVLREHVALPDDDAKHGCVLALQVRALVRDPPPR